MGQAGRYLRKTDGGYGHFCPACREMHVFSTDKPNTKGAQWTFCGTIESPAFTPSMNIRWGTYADPSFVEEEPGDSGVCHYTISSGKINFHGDCTHAMKGTVVPLPELPDAFRD